MRVNLKPVVVLSMAAWASGCMSDDYRRADGLTDGAGNAIAANTVMQMVDPWPNGVQDTELLVPAERPASAAAPAGDAKQSQTTSSSGN